eukprot:symbB.v1.2.009716.t1/scaffold624.1/size179468/4
MEVLHDGKETKEICVAVDQAVAVSRSHANVNQLDPGCVKWRWSFLSEAHLQFPSGKEPPQPIAKVHSCVVAVCCCAFDGLAMELPFKVMGNYSHPSRTSGREIPWGVGLKHRSPSNLLRTAERRKSRKEDLHFFEVLEVSKKRPRRCSCGARLLRRPKCLSLVDLYRPWSETADSDGTSVQA